MMIGLLVDYQGTEVIDLNIGVWLDAELLTTCPIYLENGFIENIFDVAAEEGAGRKVALETLLLYEFPGQHVKFVGRVRFLGFFALDTALTEEVDC